MNSRDDGWSVLPLCFASAKRNLMMKSALVAALAVMLTAGTAAADQCIADDLVVDGSMGVGFDTTCNMNFGFDTIVLKENNLRMFFDDTSNSASFPKNDWRIVINDTTNGGANYFAIEDSTASRQPFRVEAGAPSNSLYVEDSGEVGLGTANPVVSLHIVEGNTPTTRLEQDGSSGFTPQTWDLAGNETNFFIRDVTNGSKLPFRIRPNAPTSSIDVAGTTGNVGMGTASPSQALHVKRTDAAPTMILLENTNGTPQSVQIRLKSENSNRRIVAKDGSDNNESQLVFKDNGAFEFLGPAASDVRATIDTNGNFTAHGTVFANNGANSLPDYVFHSDYALMPIDEVADFVAREKHLPNVPSAEEVKAAGRIDVVDLQLKLLEKVEELTLYTIDQQKTIDELKARLEKVEGTGEKTQ